MKHFTFLKYIRLVLVAIVLFVSHFTIQAQTATTAAVKYVRVEIGHNGLHCPFLGPRIEEKFKAFNGVQHVEMNKAEGFASFELPAESTLTDTEIKDIAVKLGYPDADVKVIITNTLPPNPDTRN